jgi:hypothetical protein
MEVVLIRNCGHFTLSELAINELINLGWTLGNSADEVSDCFTHKSGAKYLNYNKHDVDSKEFRSNKDIVTIFKKLGDKALTDFESIKFEIVTIPDDIEWYIEEQDQEYSGNEIIHEKHRTW